VDDLSPRARALLDAAEGCDDPGPAEAARLRQAVLLRIGSVGFGTVFFALSVERAKAVLGVSLPKLVFVALIALGGNALYEHWKTGITRTEAVLSRSAPVGEPAPIAVPVGLPRPEPTTRPVSAPTANAPRAALAGREPNRDTLEAEMRWVRAADAALRSGDAASALGFLNQHAREFPDGVLAEEREGLRVVAACRGGISPDVQRAASRFLQRAPRSLMAGRVRAACPERVETGS
jgi:hypothetical protein